MVKTVLSLIPFLFLTLLIPGTAQAQSPEDLLPEPTCIAYSASGRFGSIPCNKTCQRKCIDAGRSCTFGDPSDCAIILYDANFPEVTQIVKPAFNPFSVELCPDPSTRPADDPYCVLNLVRLGFYGVISLMVFVIVVMGFWVVWERSTAADKPEKIEKAVAIGKNAIIGIAVTFLFIAIVQVVALLTGLTGSLFDISIVPQKKIVGRGERCEGFTSCSPGLVCVDSDGDGAYLCENP